MAWILKDPLPSPRYELSMYGMPNHGGFLLWRGFIGPGVRADHSFDLGEPCWHIRRYFN